MAWDFAESNPFNEIAAKLASLYRCICRNFKKLYIY
jgi:hypothetical protein